MPLPYQIDTSAGIPRLFRFGVWFEAVMAVGIVYRGIITHDIAVAGALLFSGLFVAGVGYMMLQVLECSVGTLDRDTVVIAPARAGFGLTFAAPSGTFRLTQFAAVRCEQTVFGPGRPYRYGPAARLYLVGKSGVPDIMFARTSGNDGSEMGQAFAAELGLPFEDTRRSFTIGQTQQGGTP